MKTGLKEKQLPGRGGMLGIVATFSILTMRQIDEPFGSRTDIATGVAGTGAFFMFTHSRFSRQTPRLIRSAQGNSV